MRRVIVTISSTIVGMVLLLSFKTTSGVTLAARPAVTTTAGPASAAADPTASSADSAASAAGAAGAAGASSGSSASASPSPSATTGATKTVTGEAADTRYGPVQVKVTTKNGVITSVEAVEYPENDGRDEQINAYAIPVLNSEAVAADSASIDAVSGATYTSNGYVESLQSALDQLK